MASLILGAGVLAYDRVQKVREKRKSHNAARFSELEKDNAARIGNLQRSTCFSQRSDWTGGGSPEHGGGAGPGARVTGGRKNSLDEVVNGGGFVVQEGPGDETRTRRQSTGLVLGGSHDAASGPPRYSADEARLERTGTEGRSRSSSGSSSEAVGGQDRMKQPDGWEHATPTMDRAEIAKINEERRKRGRGYKRLFGRKS